jgi:hypothetical protein
MQSRWQFTNMATAPLAAQTSSTEGSASFKNFLMAMECWLDHAREHELIAIAALVNAECSRRGQQVYVMDRRGCGQGALSAASAAGGSPKVDRHRALK